MASPDEQKPDEGAKNPEIPEEDKDKKAQNKLEVRLQEEQDNFTSGFSNEGENSDKKHQAHQEEVEEEIKKTKCEHCKSSVDDRGKCTNCGRPTVFTDEVKFKLKGFFMLGFPVKKACNAVPVSVDAYYVRRRIDPEFKDEMLHAQQFMGMLARRAIALHMMTDGNLAIKYLERKEKDEFSTRQEHTGRDGDPVAIDYLGEAERRAKKYESAPKPKKKTKAKKSKAEVSK